MKENLDKENNTEESNVSDKEKYINKSNDKLEVSQNNDENKNISFSEKDNFDLKRKKYER